MRDIDYPVDLVHSVANRLNELTEQHNREIAQLHDRIVWLERREFTPSKLAALAREVLDVPLADIPLNGTIKAGYAVDAANYEVVK